MDDLSRIRNIGIAAHIDAGKTTTTERILYYSGRIHRMGDVDYGTTVTDFDTEEQQRGITIYSAAVTLQWKDCRLNLIDTPGHVDFTAEVERSLRVLDGAVVVFDAKEGVEAQSETVWRQADRYRVPRICFCNKMDKVGADFDHAVQTIRTRLAGNPIPVQMPIGAEQTFRGFVDLIEMKAVVFPKDGDGRQFEIAEMSDDVADEARTRHAALVEKVAELDESLMEEYLGGGDLSPDQLRAGLRKGTLARACQPVLCGSSLRYMGVQALLDAVNAYLPAPDEVPPVRGHDPKDPEKLVERPCDPEGPLAALVFKVVAESHGDMFYMRIYSGTLKAGSRVLNIGRKSKENIPRIYRVFAKKREQIDKAYAGDIVAVIGLKDTLTGDTLCEQHGAVLLERIDFPETVISMAIEPESSADRDKLIAALDMLSRSDPTFEFREDKDTGQLLISGMGELHLEVMCHRLKRDMNVKVRVGKPRVAYREAITRPGDGEGRFERQVGAKPQFAMVHVRVEPFQPEEGQSPFRFVNELPPDRVRADFIPAIRAGALEAAQSGPLGSYPMINVKVTLTDAEDRPDESSEVAFEAAARIAVTRALDHAGPRLLEPIMKVEVVTPEEYFGAVNGDLMSRRAVITGTAQRGNNQIVDAEAPLSEMFGYATQVRSLSQGRASYSMEPLRYEPMPPNLAEKVLGVY